jgi:hypothetical protein
MGENLFNTAHKVTSENYRKGYDAVRWGDKGLQKRTLPHDKVPAKRETGVAYE